MKTLVIPLIDRAVTIYRGDAEWRKFTATVLRNGGKLDHHSNPDSPPKGNSGRQWGSWIWMAPKATAESLYHELSHFMDDMMEHLGSTDAEFRAYITGWLFPKVAAWYAAEEGTHEHT